MIRKNETKSAKLYVERNRKVVIAQNDFQEEKVLCTPEKRKERVYVVHTIGTF